MRFTFEPYRVRSIRFLELWSHGDWRVKIYGIARRGAEPAPALVAAAKEVARSRLPQPPLSARGYGVGFMGIHEGRGANFVFVDWWANENELHHHLYVSGSDDRCALEYVTPTGLAACVWDLAVIGFERQAWIEAVLAGEEPNIDGYLERRMSAVL